MKVEGLSKSFVDGDRQLVVLRQLSFSLHAGQSLAVTGASGSGKSTLLNVLAGILAPDDGQVLLESHHGDVIALHALNARQRTSFRRRNVGYVHQFFNLIPTLTVLENVLLPARLNRLDNARSRAVQLLEACDMSHRLNAFPETLSGGEQQRVAVARALIIRPSVLLADEPTGNLDKQNSAAVAGLLFRAAAEHGATLVIATHSDDVAEQADRRLNLERRFPHE